MTRLEYQNILFAIGTVEDNEKINSDRFCELNPACKAERERDRDLVLYGLMRARFEIERRFKNCLEDPRTKKEYTPAEFIEILTSYQKMIERSRDFPNVLIDDLEKSISYVLKANGKT